MLNMHDVGTAMGGGAILFEHGGDYSAGLGDVDGGELAVDVLVLGVDYDEGRIIDCGC